MSIKQKLIGILGLAFAVGFGLFLPRHAFASATQPQVDQCLNSMKFIDIAHVACQMSGLGSVVFTDSKPTDSTKNYTAPDGYFCVYKDPNDGHDVHANITVYGQTHNQFKPLTFDDIGHTTGSLQAGYVENGKPGCNQFDFHIKDVGDSDKIRVLLKGGNNQASNLDGVTDGDLSGLAYSRYKQGDPKNGKYLFAGSLDLSACSGSVLALDGSGVSGTEYDISKGGHAFSDYPDLSGLPNNTGCGVGHTNFNEGSGYVNVNPAVQIDKGGPPPPTTCKNGYQNPPACNACSDGSHQLPCNLPPPGTTDSDNCISNSNTTLEWIGCPLIQSISNGAEKINNWIEDQLSFSVDDFLPNNGNVQTAWNVIKNIVTALLVIVLLIMVISQAVGAEIKPFDAYTVKKLLPKVVIAVILMQISWQLARWAIGLANDMGHGIKQIMLAPFGGAGTMDLGSLLHHLSGFWAAGVTVSLYAALVAAAFIGAVFLPGALLIAFMAIVSVFVAFAVLMFRDMLIIGLVIFSPLALLLWVLPGMQNYWKKYTDNFIKLLLLFPIIVVVIYAGRIFAWIAGGLGFPGFIDLLMVLVGFFAPYFLLPKAYKWGGTMFAAGAAAISSNKAVTKGRDLGVKELKGWQQRRLGEHAANYDPANPDYKGAMGRLNRIRDNIRSGRVVPTRRALGVMVARGNQHKSDEGNLTKAIREREREKAASASGDVMAGKQMNLDNIAKYSRIASDSSKSLYERKNAEREIKEAMRDLIATGSTLELNNEQIDVRNPQTGQMERKYAWQTKWWLDLLNGSPELYSQVKGQAPDWVPHRTPTGLPTYRGAYSSMDEARTEAEAKFADLPDQQKAQAVQQAIEKSDEYKQRAKLAAKKQKPDGTTMTVQESLADAEINASVDKKKRDAAFRREGAIDAGLSPEYQEDLQWASALEVTVEELDAQGLARLHPTYYERIGDKAKKGYELRTKVMDDFANNRITAEQRDKRLAVADALEEPAKEFGRTIKRLSEDTASRQTLGVIMGGADTMEHLDYALQYSGVAAEDGTPLVNINAPKGEGSMKKVYDAGKAQEAAAAGGGPAAAQAAQQQAQQAQTASPPPPPPGYREHTTDDGKTIYIPHER